MNRTEAVSLLKELVSKNFVQPPFVSIEKDDKSTYSLVMKGYGDLTYIRAYLADKDLILFEDKEKEVCVIYKP